MLENEGYHLHTVIPKEERNILKVGEIFHVETDIFMLQCNECLSDFFDFSQFIAHIAIHLAQTENVDFDDRHVDPPNASKTEKSEYSSCESDFDNAIEGDECEIEEKSMLENEIKAEPIDVRSPSDLPNEYETELNSGLPRMTKYSCHRCPRVYRNKFSLKRHLEVHFSAKFSCKKCDAKFHRKDLLQRHIKQSCKERYAKSCQMNRTPVSDSRKSLRTTTVTNELIPQSPRTKSSQCKAECLRLSCASSNGEYKCSICLQIYQRKSSLKRHIDRHFGSLFDCIRCDAKFHRKDLLQRHIKQSCKKTIQKC